MEQRIHDKESRDFMDLIQLKLECCGAETMLDYRNMGQDIPGSCNAPRTNNINIRVSSFLPLSLPLSGEPNRKLYPTTELCRNVASLSREAWRRHRWRLLWPNSGSFGLNIFHVLFIYR